MPDKAPDRWRKATACEAKQRSAVAKAIGMHLKSKFDGVVSEPLAERMTELMTEMKRRRGDSNAVGGTTDASGERSGHAHKHDDS